MLWEWALSAKVSHFGGIEVFHFGKLCREAGPQVKAYHLNHSVADPQPKPLTLMPLIGLIFTDPRQGVKLFRDSRKSSQ